MRPQDGTDPSRQDAGDEGADESGEAGGYDPDEDPDADPDMIDPERHNRPETD